MQISVILPTFNPSKDRILQTLTGLKNQTLDHSVWELIIIDNNSNNQVLSQVELNWHRKARIIKEYKQGLTFARLAGFLEAKGELIVMVDDDNILDKEYLRRLSHYFVEHKKTGAVGGKIFPKFEALEPYWLKDFYPALALRDLGEREITAKWSNSYPECSPIGAGMGLRREALQKYIHKIKTSANAISDRKGNSLSSGGDNDIILEVLKSGYEVAYCPNLSLTHIIPKERITISYIARLLHDSSVSWVKLLAEHEICPWPYVHPLTVIPRQLKAWISRKAWKSTSNYLRWKQSCGIIKGQSII